MHFTTQPIKTTDSDFGLQFSGDLVVTLDMIILPMPKPPIGVGVPLSGTSGVTQHYGSSG